MYNGSIVHQARTAVHDSIEPMSQTVPDRPYILVIDDEPSIVSVIMFLLETEGYAGVGISDSQQVLLFLQQAGPQHLPSVILLDLMMPGISGYAIAAELKQNEQLAHIPIVIMTADSRVHSASAVPGAVDYLGKPFQLSTLLSKLDHYLRPIDSQ